VDAESPVGVVGARLELGEAGRPPRIAGRGFRGAGRDFRMALDCYRRNPGVVVFPANSSEVHPAHVRAAVLELVDLGLNDCEVARRTGIPRGTVRDMRSIGIGRDGETVAPAS
jgi:hypothetical protein